MGRSVGAERGGLLRSKTTGDARVAMGRIATEAQEPKAELSKREGSYKESR